eukprot:UN08798
MIQHRQQALVFASQYLARTASNRCVLCYLRKSPDGSSLKCCGDCRLTHYCSEEHQFLDWQVHKQFCKSLQNVRICAT